MIKFFKIRKKPYVGVVFVQRNFYKKLWLSRTAVVPQHLDVKVTEQTGSQTKSYSITISMQRPFNKSAQLIKSFVT